MSNWSDFNCLHPLITNALTDNKLVTPTRIQTEVFQHYPHYYDFLVAAQTGSGKTLAFAAPILSEMQALKEHLKMSALPHTILALVLTPTRELAQQIESNIQLALSKVNEDKSVVDSMKVACIIGGMSKQKQLRVLQNKKPQIVIGTPGRLHELLGEEVLNFSNLKYLVVDEADRMIEMGHFKEIDEILEHIFEPTKKEFFEDDYEDVNKMIDEKNEKKTEQFYVMQNGKKIKLNLNMNAIATQQLFEVPADMFTYADPQLQPKIEQPSSNKKVQKKGHKGNKKEQITKEELSAQDLIFLGKLKRRIFFVSATLTRQFKGSKYFIKKNRTEEEWGQKKKDRKQKRKEKERAIMNKEKGYHKQQKEQQKGLEETLPKLKALISRAKFSDKPKIIDLSSLLFLPSGLKQVVAFTEGDIQRMSYIISYLKQLPKGSKAIIFSNTIKACKRIQFFVESFAIETVSLHSHMQQKQRLKKLEKFKKSSLCNILIATDVAARGLDFNISHVIQMGVPVNGDTYVHRAGRTARASRTGEALIIVDKKQANRWAEINDIINESTPDRKVAKYQPNGHTYHELAERVTQFDWIRRNQETKDEQSKKHDLMDAEQLGVYLDEEAPRKKYDLDRQEQAMVRHEVKKKTQNIRNASVSRQQETQRNRWKKNKLVLSMDEIKRML